MASSEQKASKVLELMKTQTSSAPSLPPELEFQDSLQQQTEEVEEAENVAAGIAKNKRSDSFSAPDPQAPIVTRKNIIDATIVATCIILILVATTQTTTQVVPSAVSLSSVQAFHFAYNGSCTSNGTLLSASSYRCLDQSAVSSSSPASIFENDTSVLCVLNEQELLSAATQECEDATVQVLPKSWKAVMSFIPFVCVFQGILSFQLSSRHVAPFALAVSMVLGVTFFRDSAYFKGESTPVVVGKIALEVLDRFVWTVFEYALNVFTAFLFLRVLQLWGILERMREEFTAMASTPNRALLVVGFAFAIMLAVVAPAGSNFVIACSILCSMNLLKLGEDDPDRAESNLRIGAMALFGNALTSAFNLLGVCIVTVAEDIGPLEVGATRTGEEQTTHGALEIGRLFSEQFLILATVTPLIMAYIFHSRDDIPFMDTVYKIVPDAGILMFVGFVYGWVQIGVAGWIGPELPCLIAGAAAMLCYVLVEKRKELKLALPSWEQLKARQYVLPLILLVTILLIWGLVPGLEDALEGKDSSAEDVLNPFVLDINSGGVRFKRRFAWLTHSGIIVICVALVTPLLVPYREPSALTLTGPGIETPYAESTFTHKRTFKKAARRIAIKLRMVRMWKYSWHRHYWKVISTAFKEALRDVLPVLLSITSYAALAKLMGRFEMTQSIADVFVSILSGASGLFAVFSPIIGMLGSALTGSTTTSNFLFARLQVNTARDLGLVDEATGRNSIWEIAAVQILGATGGEIISPMNAVVISLMPGINCVEYDLISLLLRVDLIWMLLVILTSIVFIIPTDGLN